MIIKYLSYLLIVVSVSYFLSCEVQQASYFDTGFGGIVYDSSNKRGLSGVTVSVEGITATTQTDSNGNYYFGKIPVPSSAGNYYINFSLPGYNNKRVFSVLYAGDTTKRLNIAMYNGSSSFVFTVNNLVVSEYLTPKSLSMLNLYHLFVTDDSIWYDNDVFLTDSSKTRNNFTLLAGGYAQPRAGWDTRFTPLLGYYSQYDFDTLSRIDVGPRDINPNTDFPSQMTNSFNVPLTQSPVYGFFLYGRYYYNTYYPRVYGLLRIESFYYDNALNYYVAVVDVKINRNEQNYFLLN